MRLSLGFGGGATSKTEFDALSARVSVFRHWMNDEGRAYAGVEGSAFGMADIAGASRGRLHARRRSEHGAANIHDLRFSNRLVTRHFTKRVFD
jgi:hypothetical protein